MAVSKKATKKTTETKTATKAIAKKAPAKKAPAKKVSSKTVVKVATRQPATPVVAKAAKRATMAKGQDAKSKAAVKSAVAAKKKAVVTKKKAFKAGDAVTSKTVVPKAAAGSPLGLDEKSKIQGVNYMGKTYASLDAAALETGTDKEILRSRLQGTGTNFESIGFGGVGTRKPKSGK